MDDAFKKLQEELARQDKAVSVSVGEWDKLKILPSEKLMQLSKMAELNGPYVEAMRQLAELPNIQDLYPLKHIQDALASTRFIPPEMPQVDFSALEARMAEIGNVAATFSKNLAEHARLLLDFAPDRQYQKAFEEAFGRVQLAESMNFDLPRLAMLEWSPQVASQRFGLIEDS